MIEVNSVTVIKVDPVPVSLEIKGMKKFVPWSVLFWLLIAGVATFALLEYYECIKNQQLLNTMK